MQVELRSTAATDGELQAAIYRLVNEAKSSERRGCRREPFFRPVTLICDEQGETRRYSCFSRDISPTGIGLLHNMPLTPGQAALISVNNLPTLLRGRIAFCKACGEGWYLSSAEFVMADGR